MTMLSLGEAARLIPGATLRGDPATTFERVSTDSRTVGPGDLFVALKGERFDAHDFLCDVAARGAAAALVAHAPEGLAMPVIEGGETRAALGALAHGWRKQFAVPLVAVTGSNGKTTVKEMIASIFAAAVGADARLATAGNLNNDIGVPLTLLRLSAAHRIAVIELGMNHPGETEILARIAAPTVALVNNAQREHQEFMATVEAVALEHAAVIHALTPDGVAVFPADDAYAGIWRVAATGNRILDFALHEADRQVDAQVTGRLQGGELAIDTPSGRLTLRLRALGEHNARNALAATAAALGAGIGLAAIKQGLESFEPVKGRLQVRKASVGSLAGATIVDDTYNANPDSMRAAIDVLAAQPAPRVLVIGDMGEVGDEGPAFHREIGAYARERGIDALFALGDASRDACTAYGDTARHFGDVGTLVDALLGAGYGAQATVLVKGSRYMKMERVVDALTNQPATGTAPAAH
ncbi:UDP-N-acetylmuramoyl-tripeptide--D-alanyl-D-alanine ligase [Burkholderia sp. Bp9017]|uniref:UDP-N-acetylmuramoyl-tripeptide--D-alanyl-D-alanine ligase n=1 Tax=Burkholderia anthina TaxID=179879 RepID=A0A7T7AHP8_9BURK|nr:MULTISPECIES: UDP-N-acetylmuramoyl-tripeptide--D-alanyl-D-alanine ligase [Burkholderia]MBY4868353.1 UDP-N-acetylmuramoyl-tripeptide--D-alanyl-D-alanine ligase [Burkholderia anthina]QQK03060.1 UDP-N-acetylmuramoyl-tripeptide--D-alanyl-D-alanine ligase [Burkholderia anthina]RQZ28824.1 UDP-N-acetylmuramoyl-tripeptide--D-alanyl-D-alanine ligase [Burkholderia sp. Bp9017]RQZ35318.1 UDP-N-acetylmuramoyl-tripeptide--D-alanyl-D-alanine ligase [Burkholderia sp. Bp9016]